MTPISISNIAKLASIERNGRWKQRNRLVLVMMLVLRSTADFGPRPPHLAYGFFLASSIGFLAPKNQQQAATSRKSCIFPNSAADGP